MAHLLLSQGFTNTFFFYHEGLLQFQVLLVLPPGLLLLSLSLFLLLLFFLQTEPFLFLLPFRLTLGL